MDIKDFQLRYGVTNQKMAELCGCSLPTIQKWRSGAISISGAAERLMELLDYLAKGSPERLNTHLNAVNGHSEWASEAPAVARESSVVTDLEQSVSKAVEKFELALQLRHKQDELEQSEARYRAMVQTQKDAVCRWTPDTRLTFVNDAYCRIFGMDRDVLIGTPWTDLIPDELPDEMARAQSHIQRMVSTKTHRRYETCITLRNGRKVVLEWTDTPLVQPDGSVAEIQSVGRDVTSRVVAEKELRSKLNLERTITRLSSQLLAGDKSAADQMIEDCLKNLGLFAGIDRSYLFRISADRQTISNTVEWCGEGVPSIKESFQNLDCDQFPWGMGLLRSKEPVILHDVSEIPEDALAEQEAMILAGVKSLLILPVTRAQTPYGFIGFATINEVKEWSEDQIALLRMVAEMLALYYAHEEKVLKVEQQQRKIQEDAAFVRVLLDAIPFPIFSKDRDLSYRVCNKAFADGVGLNVHEVTGKTVYEVAPAELAAKYDELDRALMEQGGEQSYEAQVLFANGSLHDILFTKAVYRDVNDEVGGMVGIMQDVTERNRAQLQLQQSKERAESAAMTKTRLLSNVGHELRAPLHVVLAMTEFLQGNADAIPEDEHREVLSLIADSAHQLWVMIDELLALSHIERGRLRVSRKPFDVREMCNQLCSYYGRLAADKGLSYSCSISDDVPQIVRSSEYRVRQVLIQLLSNALKFTERGSISVSWSFKPLDSEGRKGRIRIDVADTGIGIDEESQEELYRAFEQLDGSNVKRHSGLGIGLAVARRLARGLGGDITYSSQEGQGAHFFFELPVEIHTEPLADRDVSGPCKRSATILVVDDNVLNRLVMCRMLERMGMRILSADNATQALDVLDGEECDLVLADIQMPDMDGFELLAEIRELEKAKGRAETPVVAVTAYALPSEHNRFIRAGMSEFLPKPFTFEELSRVVSGQLESSSDLDESS